MSTTKCVCTATLVVAMTTCSLAEDWPQWRGPNRDDASVEAGLLHTWPQSGPNRLWLFGNAGAGYAGFSICNGQLFTMGTRDGATVLLCLDADSGKEVWATSMSDVLANGWGDGPRSTPTVDGDLVYALSGNGDLVCAKVSDGEVVWKKSLVSDFGGKVPTWGYTESVLVDGERLICTPGEQHGAIVALDKLTGDTVWTAEDLDDGAQYASVIAVDWGGVRQYLQLFMRRLVSVAADDGRLLWEAPFDGKVAVIPTPIQSGQQVYVCAGYGVGCKSIRVQGSNVEDVYANKTMKNHHGGVILVDGKLYGHSDGVGWVCQDFATGKKIWNERSELGKGAIAYADGQLYCLDEREGTVCLIDATEKGWQEHGRFELSPLSENRSARGGIWVHPVIANGKLYLRDQEYVYCYDVKQ